MLREESPTFVWSDRTKYKNLSAESDFEQSALASFGGGVARALLQGTGTTQYTLSRGPSAGFIRQAILNEQPFVRLGDLVALCWALGIPVGYLRVFPLPAKRMSAMVVQVDGRYAILLGKSARFPAPVAYYLAHELGHIALGHLQGQSALIDIGDPLLALGSDDEEVAADRFALELLTGFPEPHIATDTRSFLARQLAETAARSAQELKIEPGTIALCFGHETGRWDKTYGALRYIYGVGRPIWAEINAVLVQQLDWSQLTTEIAQYLRLIIELPSDG